MKSIIAIVVVANIIAMHYEMFWETRIGKVKRETEKCIFYFTQMEEDIQFEFPVSGNAVTVL